MKYLNLGCGSHYHKDFYNIDFYKVGEGVQEFNLLKGIPYPKEYFDVVYHSHILEHFTKRKGEFFMSECERVLKKGGVLRVAVPDLEQIVRQYLEKLETVRKRSTDLSKAEYDWAMIELYDQATREYGGGLMGEVWSQSSIINEKQVSDRMGYEFTYYRNKILASNFKESRLPLSKKIINKFVALCKKVLRKNTEFQRMIQVNKSGELHKWMYDSYSLSELLKKTGFRDVKVLNAFESQINGWEDYRLDVVDGQVRKPDSLFIEAIK